MLMPVKLKKSLGEEASSRAFDRRLPRSMSGI